MLAKDRANEHDHNRENFHSSQKHTILNWFVHVCKDAIIMRGPREMRAQSFYILLKCFQSGLSLCFSMWKWFRRFRWIWRTTKCIVVKATRDALDQKQAKIFFREKRRRLPSMLPCKHKFIYVHWIIDRFLLLFVASKVEQKLKCIFLHEMI